MARFRLPAKWMALHHGHRYWPLALALASCLSGCGRNDRASVEGTVTIDGQPLDQGTISFIPTGQTRGPIAGASVLKGHYRVDTSKGVVVGNNRVEIRGGRLTGKKIPYGPEMLDEVIEVVPEQYHRNSTLEREIKPGDNQLDFPLTAGK